MYLYLDKPDGFTREDMEAEIKAMTREAMQAEARAAGLQEGAAQLKTALIRDVLEEAKIEEGDKCMMHFTDGDETVEFVEAKRGGIYVRHFGSKGKPHKHPTHYDYTFAELLEKLNKALTNSESKS